MRLRRRSREQIPDEHQEFVRLAVERGVLVSGDGKHFHLAESIVPIDLAPGLDNCDKCWTFVEDEDASYSIESPYGWEGMPHPPSMQLGQLFGFRLATWCERCAAERHPA
jgi:hypothetical protein